MGSTPHRIPEHRWPVAFAIALAMAIYLFLPGLFHVLPSWVVPVIALALYLPLIALNPHRLGRETSWSRALGSVIAVGLALVNQVYLAQIVHELLNGRGVGVEIIYTAAGIWVTNVIAFGVLFWEIDRGGPYARWFGGERLRPTDFRFPQEDGSPGTDPEWRPLFFDYLFTSLTAMTAFSPTDVMPLTRRAKALLGYEALTGFVLLALVIARAVNILD